MELYAIERHRWLVEKARSEGRIEVAEVARALRVSVETVRRDLSVLESEGLLRRVHGGAVRIDRAGFDHAPKQQHDNSPRPAESRIARAALELLGSAEMIYIDEGSTTQEFAKQLNPLRDLTLVTNALLIAMMLAERPHLTVIMVGGRIRSKTLATTDSWATRMMDDFVFDACFIETTGITPGRGLTCPHPAVGAVKAVALASSRRRVLLADSRKFGVDFTYRFAKTGDLHQIVTDRDANKTQLDQIQALGVEVIAV